MDDVCVDRYNNLRVANMINFSNLSWNVNLLKVIYGEHQSKEILKINVAENVEDAIIWEESSSGNMTVAQVYNLLYCQDDFYPNP